MFAGCRKVGRGRPSTLQDRWELVENPLTEHPRGAVQYGTPGSALCRLDFSVRIQDSASSFSLGGLRSSLSRLLANGLGSNKTTKD